MPRRSPEWLNKQYTARMAGCAPGVGFALSHSLIRHSSTVLPSFGISTATVISRKLSSADNLVLKSAVQFNKISAVTRNPHHQAAKLGRIKLGLPQRLG